MSSLTPEEKAEYLSDEWWRICDLASDGLDISAEIADLDKFEQNDIMTMSAKDYIRYVEALWCHDVSALAGKCICTALAGFSREHELLVSLIESQETNRRFWHETRGVSDEERRVAIQKIDEDIAKVQQRRDEVRQEMREILENGFWDTCNIPNPTRSEPSL